MTIKENIPLNQAAFEFGIVLCGLVALYMFVSWGFSRSSGWHILRAVHGVEKVDLIRSWPFESASFDKGYGIPGLIGRYRSCLRFGYSADGIYISGMFPAVFFHRPIMIPWKDAVVTGIDSKLLYSILVPNVSISISAKVYGGLVESQLMQNTNRIFAQ